MTDFSKLPTLEEITIGECSGLKNINVQSLPKLLAVTLLYGRELESFKFEAPNLKKLLLEKLYNLKVENSKLEAPNLRKLLLKSIIVTDKWLHNVLSKHSLIESLELHYCSMLKMIKISSDHLKSLTICFCTNLVEVNIITLNLHRLEYYGDVISFSSNAWTLSEVVLHFHNYAHLDVKKIEFLTKLNHPKFLAWMLIVPRYSSFFYSFLIKFFILFFDSLCHFVHKLYIYKSNICFCLLCEECDCFKRNERNITISII